MNSPLIFIGDSLTMRNNWSSLGAANMGIDGDTTSGILSRIHQTKNANKIVLMIGVNDILNRISLERIKNNYSKILDRFSDKQKIYIISLLPVIDHPQTRSINQEIRTLNRWLYNETKQRNVEYIDLFPRFLDNQKKGLKETFSLDGIHLTKAAYAVWEKVLKDSIATDY